ncbi:MAG: ribose-5-phosphate isomerase RpiA [Methanobacteriota archaeon]|nr:MAG: ribose-5-phosphate isomerase RpiA [Euryarchaeota archaeon]
MNPKKVAGEEAAEYVEDGMALGLGTGSTVRFFVEKVGEMAQKGLNVVGIPTSKSTEDLALKCGIPLTTLEDTPTLDLAVDGADEVDPDLNLIKGMGGALLREKSVAASSKEFIIVVDESKMVEKLGTKSPLPVEVSPFGWRSCKEWIAQLGSVPSLRMVEGQPYLTDNQNYLLECGFKGIEDPYELDTGLHKIPGVVETGLFLDMACKIIVGKESGSEVNEE